MSSDDFDADEDPPVGTEDDPGLLDDLDVEELEDDDGFEDAADDEEL